MIEPELMTSAEVAALFRCTPRTLWNWRSAGRLRPIKVGRSWLYPRAQIARLCGQDEPLEINGLDQIYDSGI